MYVLDEVFNKRKINVSRLEPYGFKHEDNSYSYSKDIINGDFTINVKVIDGKISASVIDNEFGDEYVYCYQNEAQGGFVGAVRESYKDVLIDIAEKCTTEDLFMAPQANRMVEYINNKYGNQPEFLWDDMNCGVFRNKKNEKWYGFINEIDRSKVTDGTGLVNVFVLKKNDSFDYDLPFIFEGYHMNKKSWKSIILDDSVEDRMVEKYIDYAYQSIDERKEWIVPANPKFYDLFADFKNRDTIEWKQSSDVQVDDIVYLYVGSPYSAMMFKCLAVEVNVPYDYKDDNLSINKLMKIKLLKEYSKDDYPFSKLNEYGIKAIRGPRGLTKKLSEELNRHE